MGQLWDNNGRTPSNGMAPDRDDFFPRVQIILQRLVDDAALRRHLECRDGVDVVPADAEKSRLLHARRGRASDDGPGTVSPNTAIEREVAERNRRAGWGEGEFPHSGADPSFAERELLSLIHANLN